VILGTFLLKNIQKKLLILLKISIIFFITINISNILELEITKNYQDNLNIQLIKEIKKSLEYAILIINKMDTNIYKRNLKITPEENLQKKAQDAENEKYDTSYLK